MARKNDAARRRLERVYGKVDMFVKAEVEKKLEALNIKGYKTFEEELRLKGRPISQQLTFHHLRHRSEGGDQSPQNGALIGLSRHEYMHSLTREEEEIANNIIRDWKMNFLIMTGRGEVLDSGTFEPDWSDCITIPVYDNSVKSKKYREYKNPTRAQNKQELRRIVEEYEEEDYLDF